MKLDANQKDQERCVSETFDLREICQWAQSHDKTKEYSGAVQEAIRDVAAGCVRKTFPLGFSSVLLELHNQAAVEGSRSW